MLPDTIEMHLIRMCCCYALGYVNKVACTPYLKNSLDAAVLVTLANEHRVLVLVYQVLSKDFKTKVSPSILKALQKEAEKIIAVQLRLMAIATEVSQTLSDAKVPYLFLKGPSLNQLLWGKRMMRYSNDLDVLVKACDVFKAHEALKMINFHPECSLRTLRFHQFLNRFSTKKDMSYWRADFSKRIELHWKTCSVEFILKPNATLEFTDELYVLYLCLHAAKHAWSRMMWLVDIIAFIRVKQLNVVCLRETAKKHHIASVVDETLFLAWLWLGIELLPIDILQRLKINKPRLDKRLILGKKSHFDQFFQEYKRLYFLNAFCSNIWVQLRLWGQVFVGGTYSICLRKLKRYYQH